MNDYSHFAVATEEMVTPAARDRCQYLLVKPDEQPEAAKRLRDLFAPTTARNSVQELTKTNLNRHAFLKMKKRVGIMKINSLASIALVFALAACGAPLQPDDEGTGSDGTDGEVTSEAPVTVPASLSNNVASAKIIRGTGSTPDTLLIAIDGLDTTPIAATWERKPSLDIPGYQAYFVQEDALDRLFVGLAASSADGSVSAVVAGDGGQFNSFFSGAQYERVGGYTPPIATLSALGSGQVSFKGKYAGLLNGGGGRGEAIPIPLGRDTAPNEIPFQPAQVTGDVFVNANFADDQVNGIIKNRNTEVSGITTNLEDVVLVPADIAANGTFSGDAQRPSDRAPDKPSVGVYGGVFGGGNASSIAGAISLEQVYLDDVDPNDALIDNALERGVFVLDQCGLTATADGDCLGTAPTP